MTKSYISKEADVLIVGGGLAGLWAAIRARDFAKKVIVAEKGKVARSGVSIFCHTTFAPIPPGQYESYLEELAERSTYLGDQRLMEIFLREIGDRIKDMISWGVEFEKNPDGSLKTEAVRGQKVTRSALYTGRQMMMKMREEALRRGVEFEERVMITDLITSDGISPTEGEIAGAVGLNTRTAGFIVYNAPSVVLSTGAMSTKTNILYTNGLSGDGHAMAFRAGAEIVNMEQSVGQTFGVWNRKFATGGQQQFLMNNARIVNLLGERIMERYSSQARANNPEFDGHIEFGDICRAMAIENMEGRGPCYFDLRGWSQENVEKMKKVLPVTMAAFEDAGIDVRKQLIESTPTTATYCASQQAGLRITPEFEGTIPGLFACGVTAFVGNGLSPQGFCNVSGYRAGEYAAKRALGKAPPQLSEEQAKNLREKALGWMKNEAGPEPESLFKALNNLVVPYETSFFKQEKRIEHTLKELKKLEKEELSRSCARDAHELIKLHEFRNALTVLKMIFTSSLERKESRFGHYREEYPYRDDLNWLKWIVAKNDGSGEVSIRTEPVPFESFPMRPEKLARIPSNTQYTIKS